MGAWSFVNPLIEEVLDGIRHTERRAVYVGRKAAAAPATGLLRRHSLEQQRLVDEALTLPARATARAPRRSKAARG